MRNLEINARRLCTIDLMERGYSREEAAKLVDRFWPVTANEIRGGLVIQGEWPFSPDEIAKLEADYRALGKRG
ncbi:hypothetical protein J2X65_003467 [Ancylobacter sp. 3268]|uniref:hypothetical protein n=1 Tax=Ancylobacter sp. 3268 TaxID=2817752 RepID=UPI00285D9710|nr:hypothetical protein [Ancylobacter sp. 3268]MDR6954099.1 hypothetical protein [Ancylobacter sp. 3268]